VAVLVLGDGWITADARAHSGGKAVPVVSATIVESGPLQALVDVRLRDEDGGEPVRGAEVRGAAKMTSPHVMFTYFGPLPEVSPGRYRARVKLPMAARWAVELAVAGAAVAPRTARVGVTIERTALTDAPGPRPAAATTRAPAQALVGTVRFDVTRREIQDMVVLWTHGIAATGWIVGLTLLLVAVTAGSGALLPAQRDALARWYRRVGLPFTWIAAAVVVATGAYNAIRVTPFELVWRPGELERLDAIPYGTTYQAILLVKLALFAVMLVAGLRMVARAGDAWNEPRPSGERVLARSLGRLGPAGVVFLLSAPAIVAAAVALRYVHILSHVAEASGS
jgi:hypothetical protein